MTTIKSIHSELLKLKYPPILWLIILILLIMFSIVFFAHYIEIHKTVTLGRNPWTKLNYTGEAIFSMFIGIPFTVLLISAAVHIEHQNNGFKQLYALPKRRVSLIIYKLVAIFSCFAMAIILLILGNIIIGYVLNFIYPETEFSYYPIPLLAMLKSYAYISIAYLGIIGIQFFLSFQFKGFLVPASFGILAYVLGLILSSINHISAIYFPYSYPIVARDRGVLNNTSLNIDQSRIINNVEMFSIMVFIIFILLTLFFDKKKNI